MGELACQAKVWPVPGPVKVLVHITCTCRGRIKTINIMA